MALSSADSELYAAVKTASEGLGVQNVAKDLEYCVGISCGLNLHLDASATMCFGQPQGIGQGEARRHAESVDTGGFQIWPVHHEESRHERESRRPLTKPSAKPKIEQLLGIMGYRFIGDDVDSKKGRSTGTR